MSSSKRGLVVLLVLIGFLHPVYAQFDFRPGYIIQNNGDTIHGEIDYRNDKLMSSLCTFKYPNGRVKKFEPTDIHAYRFIDDGKYYVSKKVKNIPVFLEYLIDGVIEVYYMKDSDGEHYYIKKENLPLKELKYTTQVVQRDGNIYRQTSNQHIHVLNYYMNDASNLHNRINNFPKPDHDNLIRLARDYHTSITKADSYIIYEKKLPFIQIGIEPIWGLIKYKYHNNFYHSFGSHLHLLFPRTSDILYIKTGFLFTSVNDNLEHGRIYKLPLNFQYSYPSGKFRPHIGAGVNVYHYDVSNVNSLQGNTNDLLYEGFQHALAANIGINYQFTKTIEISLSFHSEFTPLTKVWVSNQSSELNDSYFDYISYSFHLGLYLVL